MKRKYNHQNKPHLTQKRKFLRNNSTKAEIRLWQYVKNKQINGLKFRRQYSIYNFILDFYCPAKKIAIELDGEIHKNPISEQKDHQRDFLLEKLGIKVLRFENDMVFKNPEIIVNAILDHIKT
ncbi:endonuclease domain-containing protein [Namhaeicola litoreus]|uniref:Endonuclease domain-containing protein n=1 Tax=Namhaeicola litoreus TaxID=1052145 RepID=A0ABW3Y2M6_9FLAO